MKTFLKLIVVLSIFVPFNLTLCSAKSNSDGFRRSFYQTADSLLKTPDDLFAEYAKDLAGYNTEISIPAGFKPVDLRPAKRYFEKSSGSPYYTNEIYSLGLEADNNDAMILLPNLFFDGGNATLRRGREIESEIRAVHNNPDLDINPYVDIYDVRNRSGYANADTVAIYELNAHKADALFSDRYPHCIGIYLRKSHHPAILLKLLLSDEGYANKNDYVNTLFNHINYGRNATPLILIEYQLKDYYTDLGLPSIPDQPYKARPIMDDLPKINYFKK